jgi:hypothetical protein
MSPIDNGIRFAALGLLGSLLACAGGDLDSDPTWPEDGATASVDSPDETEVDEADEELGTGEQPLFALGLGISFLESCNDPTGVDSVLAGLAVATATELRRWQPKTDFDAWSGKLRLTATGKKQCADGACFNTQALLDMQNDAAGRAEIRPGVRVNPLLLRTGLTVAYFRQATCYTLLGLPLIGCGVPEHQFTMAHSEPGKCDTNYWFTTTTPAGKALSSSAMKSLEKGLVFLNTETNAYIQFQTNGNMVGIDPTYGLNEVGATASGSCSAACTKVSRSNIVGQCCSCNGIRKYSRSTWNANTYLCK